MRIMPFLYKEWHKVFAFSERQTAHKVDIMGYVTWNYAFKCKNELQFPQGNTFL
jgi:hypothetical protein